MTLKPKVAMLANPLGGHNRKGGQAVAALARESGLAYREATKPEAIRSALRELAGLAPELLIISGGDGTISAVTTALRREPLFDPEPVLALLRGGSTNLIQSNIGLRRRPIEALKNLMRVCEHGLPEHLVRPHSPMRVQASGAAEAHYGFCWGAGALPRILRSVQDRYERGGRRGLIGEAAAFAAASLTAFLGDPANDPWLAPRRVVCSRGDAERTDAAENSNRILAVVTSLNHLVVGLNTYLERGGLRWLTVNYPCRRRALAAYALSRGRVFPWMRNDFGFEEDDAFTIQVTEEWALDGQIYPADPQGSWLHFRLEAPLRFLVV